MTTPAGWYDDGSGELRYWDGTQWTDHRAARPTAPAGADDPFAASPETAAVATPPSAMAQPGAAPMQAGTAYAQPGAAPAGDTGGGRNRTWMWVGIIGGGVVVLGVIAVVAVVMLVSNATSGPREAIDAIAQTWRDADCVAEYELYTDAVMDGDTVEDFCEYAEYEWVEAGDFEYTIVSLDVTNDVATVVTEESYTLDGELFEERWEYRVVKQGGEWLIDDAQIVE
jgi:hypothetical protein